MPEPEAADDRAGGRTFRDLPLHGKLQQGVAELGYVVPTAIQSGAIPWAVEGRDIIGASQTGTGKTAAFLLPILERLLDQPPGRLYALILTPTRELALQAEGFLHRLAGHTRLRGIAVYGGVGLGDQERALRDGVEIVIATPGRLLDHMQRGSVDFRSLRILVLDEADRMLDMGFLPDVRRILRSLPRERQTMLFSATMPPEIVSLAREFLHEPKLIHVEPETVAAVGVTHLALPVPAHRKLDLLIELLRDELMTSVLVFVRTKRRADRLARDLARRGLSAAVIHGDRSQRQRIAALEGFREGRHRILVATDIAARGIDVQEISHVVNYDVPGEPETYVHRVGRTARARRRGDAYTLVAPEEEESLRAIERGIGLSIPRTRLPDFAYDLPPPVRPAGIGGGHSPGREIAAGRRGRGRRRRNGPPPPRGTGPRRGRPGVFRRH
ncbi:MAG: DEAD/DEAH box helicase [Thermoplasmata archaeon]